MTKVDTQCLKGVAILMMIFFHTFSQSGQIDNITCIFITNDVLYKFSVGCQLCVSIFVFVTSYGTACKYVKKDVFGSYEIASYTGKRYIKLMSSFIFVYILSLIFGILKKHTQNTYFNDGIVNGIKFILADMFGMASKLATPTLNSSWWFISMAIMLIFILPPIIIIVRKLGFFVSIVFFYFTYYTFNLGLTDYYYIVIIGVALSTNNLYEKIIFRLDKSKNRKILAYIFTFLSIVSIYYRDDIAPLLYSNIICIVLVCIACCLSVRTFKFVEIVLKYLGLHSTNMWLTHVFIYYYYYSKYVYSLKYSILVYLSVVTSSLLISICIEKIKILIGWDNLVEGLCYKWDTFLNKIKIV